MTRTRLKGHTHAARTCRNRLREMSLTACAAAVKRAWSGVISGTVVAKNSHLRSFRDHANDHGRALRLITLCTIYSARICLCSRSVEGEKMPCMISNARSYLFSHSAPLQQVFELPIFQEPFVVWMNTLTLLIAAPARDVSNRIPQR